MKYLRGCPSAHAARELRFLPLGLALCFMAGPCAAESLDAAVRAQTQNQDKGSDPRRGSKSSTTLHRRC